MRVFHRSWKCWDHQHVIRLKTFKSLRLFLSCTLLRYKFPENTKHPLTARLTTGSNITLAVGLIKDLWLCWKMEWSRLGIDLLTNMTNTVLSEVHLQHSGYQHQHTNYPKLFVNILGLKRKIQTISPR